MALQRTKNKAGQPRTRARMSYKTFRRLTGRRIGGAKFVREFTAEMMNLGWLMVRMPSAYGFVRAASLDKWQLTKSDAVAQELKLINEGAVAEALDIARQELGEPGHVGKSTSAYAAPIPRKKPGAMDK
ncbi:hypothetical protein X765_19595 [Mesorhizobium sp. LSHC440B00]|nr:hypothetical protein X765_19595 [Mesorhizobium sp. LSHC440B00]ESX36472.1 hypothetical protein X763_13905 [Mesorhizobium sp. LSHC432A00]ESX78371.1 hypothetical protein X757_06820 [Mesorhizobium sp. LSHC414A00]ESZ24634.1 hypothetical protein X733_31630 [Mesorhizobium sp. L2C067A000]